TMEQTKPDFRVAKVVTARNWDAFQEPAVTRTCLVVLGMHRSGTSAMAGTLGLLGVTLPTDLLGPAPGNAKGHFESTALYTIHERMLSALYTNWYDFRHISPAMLKSDTTEQFKTELIETIKSKYGTPSLFVFKDPRTCRFLPLYRSVIEACGASLRIVFI